MRPLSELCHTRMHFVIEDRFLFPFCVYQCNVLMLIMLVRTTFYCRVEFSKFIISITCEGS